MAEESKLKNFFNKAKSKIGEVAQDAKTKLDEVTLESKINSAFKNNEEYELYKGASLLQACSYTIYAIKSEGCLTTLTDIEISDDMLVKAENDEVVYTIEKIEPTKVSVEVDGMTYERDGLKIVLGKEATKVDVIKVGNDFYLKK